MPPSVLFSELFAWHVRPRKLVKTMIKIICRWRGQYYIHNSGIWQYWTRIKIQSNSSSLGWTFQSVFLRQ